jgi:hypothetical protein
MVLGSRIVAAPEVQSDFENPGRMPVPSARFDVLTMVHI